MRVSDKHNKIIQIREEIGWPITTSCWPYLIYFTSVAGLSALWETIEALLYIFVSDYFKERPGDTNVGDMLMNYSGSFLAILWFYNEHPDQISIILSGDHSFFQ